MSEKSSGRPDEARERAARRRRLAEVFGDDLPEQTRDDLPEPEAGGHGEEDASEEWLRRQVPPHHG